MSDVFDPKLKIGQAVSNADIVKTFKCGNAGNIRRSRATNTLVLISDYTKGKYHDNWIEGVLHYTGMGKSGDQDIDKAPNSTLAECGSNGVDVHLFEVLEAGKYVYCGRVERAGDPYSESQVGDDGNDRKVWLFPMRPLSKKKIIQPEGYVFATMEEYLARGGVADPSKMQTKSKAVTNAKVKEVEVKDAEVREIEEVKEVKDTFPEAQSPTQPEDSEDILPDSKSESKPIKKLQLVVPQDIVGKKVKHKKFGAGMITKVSKTSLFVDFKENGEKNLGYEFCMKNKLLEIG
ncbi:MAG: hypothetical protein IJ849_04545 [Selenomonadaceae bacterium]|nr:hypothetical protein [Selenomonadaceae bacterium]